MPELTLRLRPKRLCFLIRPNRMESFRKAVAAASSLWGGLHCAIVPVYSHTPRWWQPEYLGRPNAADVIRGYIEAFEPDYIVELDAKLPAGVMFPERRIVEWFPAGTRSGLNDPLGVPISQVLEDLHEREFKFVRRHPVKTVAPVSANGREAAFVETVFGAICPEDRQHLEGALDAEIPTVTSANYGSLTRALSPINIGMWRIDSSPRHWSDGPTLMLVDEANVRDLIDFWNLRAIGWRVLAVPVGWTSDPALQAWCGEIVAAHYGPHRYNPEITVRATLLKGRRLDKATLDAIRPLLNGGIADGLVSQSWYPRFESDWSRRSDHLQRCVLSAGETKIEVSTVEIAVKQQDPPFRDRLKSIGWVNVVEVSDYDPDSPTALVLPAGTRDVGNLYGKFDRLRFTSGSEGLVIQCATPGLRIHASLPTGEAIFADWLRGKGFEARLSGAGRTAQHVLHALGGPRGASILASEALVRALNDMAHGLAVEQVSERGPKTKTRARDHFHAHFLAMLKKEAKGDKEVAARRLEYLVSKRVIEVGLRTACPNCEQGNWHRLADLSRPLRCERCLEDYAFPASRPPERAWSYRVVGPFSAADFAQGAYAVALALRFFVSGLHCATTWIPSMNLVPVAGAQPSPLEFDFGTWLRPEGLEKQEPRVVLGECKTFLRFEAKDVERAEALAEALPGIVFAFCTLNSALETSEMTIIKRLARKGRPTRRHGPWTLPVVVLTRRELFSEFGPPDCWDDGDRNRHGHWSIRDGGLEELANITQQLHLGMPSVHVASEW